MSHFGRHFCQLVTYRLRYSRERAVQSLLQGLSTLQLHYLDSSFAAQVVEITHGQLLNAHPVSKKKKSSILDLISYSTPVPLDGELGLRAARWRHRSRRPRHRSQALRCAELCSRTPLTRLNISVVYFFKQIFPKTSRNFLSLVIRRLSKGCRRA